MRRTIVALLVLAASAQAQLKTPEWAKEAVWYQIFPDRFRNGDPKNDPKKEEMDLPEGREWRISPWTSDWYKLQPWEEKHSPEFYRNVFDRRYGGDIQGVIEKLDYIADLGVNAIYFNPVFEAFSLHKYDASSYHHIDNNFGPDAQGDIALTKDETDDPATWHWSASDKLFLTLIKEAHKRNIRVVIDGVFNHSGTRCFAFADVRKNQQKSRYASWYDIRAWDDPATPENEFKYKGWWDEQTLPEFWEDENGFVAPVKQYVFNITKRWMDPNGDGNPEDGIDGWRLDVANEVSHQFWKEWRKVVKGVNPNAYIVAELWDNAADWLKGDEFDAAMNYPFAKASIRYFVNSGSKKSSASELMKELKTARGLYQDEANYVLQNLFDSHDTDRLPSMIANPNRDYDNQNGVRANPNYNVSKPDESTRQIQKLMVLFQMTSLGAPMVYYGDEAGMWGADDPDERKPMVWADLNYDAEESHPIAGKSRPSDAVKFDPDLFAWYKKMIKIRKDLPALNFGSLKVLLTNDKTDVLVFEREYEGSSVIVALNNSTVPSSVELAVKSSQVVEMISGRTFNVVHGIVTIPLNAKGGAIVLPVGSL